MDLTPSSSSCLDPLSLRINQMRLLQPLHPERPAAPFEVALWWLDAVLDQI
jgi:hypothetical protein